MPINDRYSSRGARRENLLEVVNQEVLRIGAAVREVVNRGLQVPLRAETESGLVVAINWRLKRHARISLSNALAEVTFVNPEDAGWYSLEIDQIGGGNTIGAWPADVRWPGASAPTVTATNGRIDLFEFYWTGSVYLARVTQDLG